MLFHATSTAAGPAGVQSRDHNPDIIYAIRLAVQHEPLAAGTRNADHHRAALPAFLLGEHVVPVLGLAVEHLGLAAAADPVPAVVRHVDALVEQRFQDRTVRRNRTVLSLRASSTSMTPPGGASAACSGAANRSTRSRSAGQRCCTASISGAGPQQ